MTRRNAAVVTRGEHGTSPGGAKLGVLGRLAMAAMAADAPHEQILDRYAAALERDAATPGADRGQRDT